MHDFSSCAHTAAAESFQEPDSLHCGEVKNYWNTVGGSSDPHGAVRDATALPGRVQVRSTLRKAEVKIMEQSIISGGWSIRENSTRLNAGDVVDRWLQDVNNVIEK